MDAVWHNNLIPFEKADIYSIAKTLERFYNVKIILSPDITINNTYSGVLKRKDSINSVLKSLKNSIPIDYKIVGRLGSHQGIDILSPVFCLDKKCATQRTDH